MERVAGKIAIVTGGAQGLGEAAVQKLIQEGALVVLSDTNAANQIRCNSIHPGIMYTPMFEALLDATGDKATADAIETQIKRQTPMGNIGGADDIGDMVLFLASSESKYITGTEMVVDGGATSGLPF
jgi:NAD(P)-dependent dehydrogenase (short-subunit alcohol dehydrogenase family)